MILIICGSPRGDRSISLKTAQAIAEYAGEPYELVTPGSTHIEPCRGCMSCFATGHCAYEDEDDLRAVIDKMLRARAVILACPVYAGGVTGQLKILIDRLSTQCHTMPLLGCIGITVTTADSNHVQYVDDYLAEVLGFWGALTAARVRITKTSSSLTAEEAGTILKNALLADSCVPVSEQLRSSFAAASKRYRALYRMKDVIPNLVGEATVWFDEYGNGRSENIEEIIKSRKSERR